MESNKKWEVDLMPAEAYTTEASASGRVATLQTFRVTTPKPQKIHVPDVYSDIIRFIYGGILHECHFTSSTEDLPGGVATRVNTQIFYFANVARLAVHEAGKDFASVFEEEERKAQRAGVIVFQAWLKLSCPCLGRIVDILRSGGYFFGGVMPRWSDVDGLLMQKVVGPPHWDGLQLFTERARTILVTVKADWLATQGMA